MPSELTHTERLVAACRAALEENRDLLDRQTHRFAIKLELKMDPRDGNGNVLVLCSPQTEHHVTSARLVEPA